MTISVKLTILSIPASPVEADEEGSLLTRKPQDKSTASLLPNLSPASQLHHTQHSFTGWWWCWCCVCFAEEEQLSWRPAGPSCPDHSGQHCENAVTTKKSDYPPPHPPSSNPITQNQRQGPLGALPRCARAPVEPGVQELWPRGLQSRNCALCAAEICTVISSAARVRRLRVAHRPGPDRLRCRRVSGLNGTEMGKSEAGLLLLQLRITNTLTSRLSSKHRMLMQKNLQKSDVSGCDSQQS